ncbi:E3 ubiquitin-protein ligase MIB2-like [Anneissia japonica]|uniref:E3 ubiquitin-protein ligase MIB2-like n=1 Tax=Anneissia japonica TaxID=1529436 RepID=UPI001425AD63|nr:E3 ubiquitin-protein ligase MIB2-like [Anneissia japonica]XP_033097861.1 E3 ubiquitin-protein ligase MIB2-like [Anneissia japonica]
MNIGCRVVRGPDWAWKDQDGGEGHVGTVVETKKQASEGSIWIQWDMGGNNKYRNGHKEKFDLRVYDTAPAGVVHPTITCDACHENGLCGIRWKCNDCYNYDLCNSCYMGDKHDLKHVFKRFDSTNSDGVVVPCRLGAVKLKAYGIFKDASVECAKNADIKDAVGTGKVTKVEKMGNAGRNAVEVKWENGEVTTCKVGFEGKVELKCVSEAEGGSYYRDHLASSIGDMRSKAVAVAVPQTVEGLRRFKPGDKIRVKNLPVAVMEVAQDGHGGWNEEMAKSIGVEGIILKTDPDGDSHVAVSGHMWCFNSDLLELVQSGNPDNVGVSLLADLYNEAFREAIGGDDPKALTVAAKQGDLPTIRQLLDKHAEWVNHQCTPGELTALQIAAHEGHVEVVDYLVGRQADLNLRDSDGDSALLCAAHGNKPEVIRYLLSCGANPNLVNNRLQTGIYIAAGKGYHECVAVFLLEQFQCNPNMQDADGDTPLHMAINKDYEKTQELLINSPKIDFTISNFRGFNALHHAALRGSAKAVEMIVEQPAGKRLVDQKKKDGFTALHVAVVNDHVEVAKVLINKGEANLEVKNNRGATPLMSAVEEFHQTSVEVLVESGADVHTTDNDGDTCLHTLMIKQAINDLQGSTDDSTDLVRSLLAAAGINDKRPAPEPNSAACIAVYLVANGASLEVKNKKGKTPADLNKNPRVAEILNISSQQWKQSHE